MAFFFNLMLTSWAVGIFVSGLVLRNGMGAENLAWSIMFLFMPLTCVYYPVTTLPVWLQPVAWMLPPTYVFEGMRALLIQNVFRPDLMIDALALNVGAVCRRRVRLPQASAERAPARFADADRRIARETLRTTGSGSGYVRCEWQQSVDRFASNRRRWPA